VILQACDELGVRCAVSHHVVKGGEGAKALADTVLEALDEGSSFRFLYDLSLPLVEKIETIATQIYGADGIDLSPAAARGLADYERLGYGELPVVIAKTHLSISSDPKLRGAPTGWRMPVREVRLAAGAGYVYAICGDMRTMPGLPSHPNATKIDLDADGNVTGLF
jgi:formate--tetrahydrofolate ligase